MGGELDVPARYRMRRENIHVAIMCIDSRTEGWYCIICNLFVLWNQSILETKEKLKRSIARSLLNIDSRYYFMLRTPFAHPYLPQISNRDASARFKPNCFPISSDGGSFWASVPQSNNQVVSRQWSRPNLMSSFTNNYLVDRKMLHEIAFKILSREALFN